MASTSSLPNVFLLTTIATWGRRDGSGVGDPFTHIVAPLLCMSSHLLYISCTFQVFAPTVMLPEFPLQISPFSATPGSTHAELFNGSVIISVNSWEVTWVCRCSWVCARCSVQLLSLGHEFVRQVFVSPGMMAKNRLLPA